MAETGERAESALSLTDIESDSDEPRIKDVRLGERLGMAQPLNIREAIESNRAELERYGEVFTRSVKTSAKGGRPGCAYYLNEPQTLLLCMLSRTERAADVRQEVIKVFMAWRRSEERVAVRAHTRRKARPSKQIQDAATRIDPRRRHLVWFDGHGQMQSKAVGAGATIVDGSNEVNLLTFLREEVPSQNVPQAFDCLGQRLRRLAEREIARRRGSQGSDTP